MITEKTINGYQASAKVGTGILAVYFIGFGDTRMEAIEKCLLKVTNFIK